VLRWAVCNGELRDGLIFGIFHLKWYSLLHFLDIYIFSTKWTSKYMYLSRLWNRHRMRSSLTMSNMPWSQQISVYLKQAVCSEEVWTQRSLLPASAMAWYNNVAPGTVMEDTSQLGSQHGDKWAANLTAVKREIHCNYWNFAMKLDKNSCTQKIH